MALRLDLTRLVERLEIPIHALSVGLRELPMNLYYPLHSTRLRLLIIANGAGTFRLQPGSRRELAE